MTYGVGYTVLMAVEVAFNVYPGTWWSSLLLQGCHAVILIKIFISSVPPIYVWTSVDSTLVEGGIQGDEKESKKTK